jgi:hypothetical protein
MRASKRAAISADRDRWTKQAFESCVVAAKDLVGVDGPIRPLSPISKLGEDEWGWIASTIVWAWIATRSEQAAVEGWDRERAAHTIGLTPDPWVAGVIAAVLPKLAEACPELDWAAPVGAWPKDDVVAFLLTAFNLIQHALAARDAAENPPGAGGADPDVIARQLNAAAGNPRITIVEHKQLSEGCLEE